MQIEESGNKEKEPTKVACYWFGNNVPGAKYSILWLQVAIDCGACGVTKTEVEARSITAGMLKH